MNMMLKNVAAAVVVMGLGSGAAFGGVLTTIFNDDFEDGNLGAGATVWTPSTGVDTTNVGSVPSPIWVMRLKDHEKDVTTPAAYTYNAGDPDTVNLGGPEWRLTFLYSNSNGNGAGGGDSIFPLMGIGTGGNRVYARIGDTNAFAGGTKVGLWNDPAPPGPSGGFDSTFFGTGLPSNGVGIHWYEVVMAWEGSTSTLSLTFTDTENGANTISGSIATTITAWDTLRMFGSGIAGGKSYYVDDVHFEATMIPEPATLALVGIGLACMLQRRRA